MADVFEHNRRVWDVESLSGESRWCQPVSAEVIERARRGQWSVILTPRRPVPAEWLGDVSQRLVLCLASGGGQQAPVLAAAGACVTSVDASRAQLDLDAQVAEREQLPLRTLQGSMTDLGMLQDASFDLVFHPVSNLFVEDVHAVWRECHRVLRPGGRLLAGFMNPDFFLFDHDDIEAGGPLELRFSLPYSDLKSLGAERLRAHLEAGRALQFGHSFEDQIGGQLSAGFVLEGFYEDRWLDDTTPLNGDMALSMATVARKPA